MTIKVIRNKVEVDFADLCARDRVLAIINANSICELITNGLARDGVSADDNKISVVVGEKTYKVDIVEHELLCGDRILIDSEKDYDEIHELAGVFYSVGLEMRTESDKQRIA